MREFTLNGAQRNYRKPKAKLLPRDAYTAHCLSPRGYRSSAEVRRSHAAELKAMGGLESMDLCRAEKRVIKLRKGMSTRAIKRVERMLEDMKDAPKAAYRYVTPGARNQQRLFNAFEDVRVTHEIMDIDARMLANAY
jgi:hypothetical protein